MPPQLISPLILRCSAPTRSFHEAPISPPRRSSGSITSPAPPAASSSRIISIASRSIRSAAPSAGLPRRGQPHPHVVHEIANSGLTLSKLSVAASLLGDLVKQ
jgi:hypothetical protein